MSDRCRQPVAPWLTAPWLAAPWLSAWWIIAALWLVTAAWASAAPGELPRPDLERVNPAVRTQFMQARQEYDRLQRAATDLSRLAELAGELGRMYLAYDYLDAAVAAFGEARLGQPREFRWVYLQGFALERYGRLEPAIEALSAALVLRPSEPVVQVRLADIHLLGGRLEQAKELYTAAFATDPTCTSGLYGMGQVARRQGRLELAAGLFEEALQQRPGTVQILYPLAQTLRQLGQVEEARQLLAQVDFKQASLGRWEACRDPWASAIPKIATGAPAHILRATQAAFAGNTELELAELRKAVTANPQDAVAHKSLAVSLQREGDLEGAEQHFGEAVRLDPGDAVYRYALAEVLLQKNQVAEAVILLRRALEINPEYLAANLRLAQVLLQNKRFTLSIEHSTRVLAVDPQNLKARLSLAMAYLQLGRVGEAASELGQLLDSQAPESPAGHLQLATLLGSLGDLPRAMRHYAAILEGEVPDEVRALAHTRLGQGHFRLGDLAASLAAFRAAVAIDPQLQEARSGLAQALEQQEKMAQ